MTVQTAILFFIEGRIKLFHPCRFASNSRKDMIFWSFLLTHKCLFILPKTKNGLCCKKWLCTNIQLRNWCLKVKIVDFIDLTRRLIDKRWFKKWYEDNYVIFRRNSAEIASLESPLSAQQVCMLKLCDWTSTTGATWHPQLWSYVATSRNVVCPQCWVSLESSWAEKYLSKLENVNTWSSKEQEASEVSLFSLKNKCKIMIYTSIGLR